MFEGDSADMCAGKIPLVSMGGRAEVIACADPGARTPIGASGNVHQFSTYFGFITLVRPLARKFDCSRCSLSSNWKYIQLSGLTWAWSVTIF